MYIDKLRNQNVVICQPDDSIQKAAQTMRNNHVGDIVVVEYKDNQHLPIGALADRDVVTDMLINEINLNDVAVKYVISNEILTAVEDDYIIETIAHMRDAGVSSVPVVNQKGGLEGVLLEGALTVDVMVNSVNELLSNLLRLLKHKFKYSVKTHKLVCFDSKAVTYKL